MDAPPATHRETPLAVPLLTIILVEDEPVDVSLIRWVLDAHTLSYELQVIDNADRAAAVIDQLAVQEQRRAPTVILLDLHLPQRDGKDLLRQIKALPHGVQPQMATPKVQHVGNVPWERLPVHVLAQAIRLIGLVENGERGFISGDFQDIFVEGETLFRIEAKAEFIPHNFVVGMFWLPGASSDAPRWDSTWCRRSQLGPGSTWG